MQWKPSKFNFCFVVVDDSYDGPHLEDGKVTFEFVQQLLTRFKDQRKIHKKYAYKVTLFHTVSILFCETEVND